MASKDSNKLTVRALVLEYAKTYPLYTSFFLLFGMFWAFTLPYMAYLFGQIIDTLSTNQGSKVSAFTLVGTLLTMYVGIHILRSFGYFTFGYCFQNSIPATKSKMISRLFKYLGGQSSRYFEDKYSGYLSNKISNAVNALEPILDSIFGKIFPQSLAILFSGILLSTVSPYFGLLFWTWGVLIMYYTYSVSKSGRDKSKLFAQASSGVMGKIIDVVSNIQTVIHNATIETEARNLQTDVNEMKQKDQTMLRHMNKVMLVQFLSMNFLVLCYFVGLFIGYDQGTVSIGDIAFVMNAVFGIMTITSSLGQIFLQTLKEVGKLQEGLALLQNHYDIVDKPDAQDHPIVQGAIDINDIQFHYKESASLFEHFSLRIPAGQKVGIVGHTGSGKTTLINLLLRLYDTTSGTIEIDGLALDQYTKKSLRSQIAVVPQSLSLFHRSVYDNLCYGCEDKTMDQVIAVAKLAHCHDFISSLDDGYSTLVGEKGVKLSGGQKQRIAIARAMLKDAPILLLDEATSALDSETESKIQHSLETLLQNKTALVVAHRLSTLKSMDKIIVLEQGKMVESGTHKELLEQKGLYHRFWSHQSEGFIGNSHQ